MRWLNRAVVPWGVYDVFVLDSSNNIHSVIVDPGNGRILSNQQMSMMDMMFMMHHPSMGMGSMMGRSTWHGYDETWNGNDTTWYDDGRSPI